MTRSNRKAASLGRGGRTDAWTRRLVFEPYVGDVIPKSDAIKKWGDSKWQKTFWKYFHIRRTCLNHPDLTPPLEHAQCDVAMLPKREKENGGRNVVVANRILCPLIIRLGHFLQFS